MNILSLFGGIECGYSAFEDNNIKIENYYSCEIDKYAKAITRYNIQKVIDLEDVIKLKSLPKNIDILIGGSPCQDLRPGRDGLKGTKSKLFYEYLRIKNELNPKWFILENVGKMKDEDKQIITELMGVEPIRINSNLVSAQNRDRYYWTNIPNVTQPEDRNINLIDILQPLEEVDSKYFYTERLSEKVKETFNLTKNYIQYGVSGKGYKSQQDRIYPISGKAPCIPANQGQNKMNIVYKINKEGNIKNYQNKASTLTGGGNSGGNHSDMDIIVQEGEFRRLTPLEAERLQTLPENWTKFGINEKGETFEVSDSQRYKCIGNGWTRKVITHILSGLCKQE